MKRDKKQEKSKNDKEKNKKSGEKSTENKPLDKFVHNKGIIGKAEKRKFGLSPDAYEKNSEVKTARTMMENESGKKVTVTKNLEALYAYMVEQGNETVDKILNYINKALEKRDEKIEQAIKAIEKKEDE